MGGSWEERTKGGRRTGDELVAFQVMGAALFEENIGFVEEEDGVPFGAHFEHVGERGFDVGGVEIEVAGAHHVEWRAHVLGHWGVLVRGRGGDGRWLTGFCGQCLPYSRWAAQ